MRPQRYGGELLEARLGRLGESAIGVGFKVGLELVGVGGIPDAVRRSLWETAIRLGESVNYANAGTVEDHKRLVATAQHAITKSEAEMADATDHLLSKREDRLEIIHQLEQNAQRVSL